MSALPPIPFKFNVVGPCLPGEHYMLPPLDRQVLQSVDAVQRILSRRLAFWKNFPSPPEKTHEIFRRRRKKLDARPPWRQASGT